MAIVQEQKAIAAEADAQSVTAYYSTSPTDNNLLILVYNSRGDGYTLPGGWTLAVEKIADGSCSAIAYKIASGEGTAVTVTLTGGTDSQCLTIFEYSGMNSSTPFDKSASNNSSIAVGSLSTGTTPTTTQANELLIAGIGTNGGGVTWNNSWTNLFVQESAHESATEAWGQAQSTASRIVSATGTYETTESWSPDMVCLACIATFKAVDGVTYKLEGITKDKNGNILVSCKCFLFKDNLDNTLAYVNYTLSDGVTGAYNFTGIGDNNAQYIVVGWKDDTPHIFDVTDHVLEPVAE